MGNCNKTTKLKSDEERVQEECSQLFPNFKPLTKESEQWQKDKPVKCPECIRPFDFLTFMDHCRSCGRIFCTRCCYARDAIGHHPVCGLCMGGAMRVLRVRELSQIETRMRKHSQISHRSLPPSPKEGGDAQRTTNEDHPVDGENKNNNTATTAPATTTPAAATTAAAAVTTSDTHAHTEDHGQEMNAVAGQSQETTTSATHETALLADETSDRV